MNEHQEPEMLLQACLVLIRFFTTLLLNVIGWYSEGVVVQGVPISFLYLLENVFSCLISCSTDRVS